MTDEERQKLCDDMREPWKLCDDVDADLAALMTRAADEIERLAAELKQVESENEHHIRLAFVDAGANPARTWKEAAERLAALAQSDAEPVAWRYRWRVNAGVKWTKWREVNEIGAKYYAGLPDHEVQPLYTAPPRADTSAKHPIGFDDKPMTDWYYDDDGVCRPSCAADRRGND